METSAVIYAHGLVLTCDSRNRAGRLHFLVQDGRFMDIGENLDALRAAYPSATIFDASSKLITPGFVNAHFHSESLVARDLTAGKNFAAWRSDPRLRERMALLAEPNSAEDLAAVALYSSCRHLASGTTCAAEFPPAAGEKGYDAMIGALGRTPLRSRVVLQSWDQINHARAERRHPYHVAVSIGRETDLTVYSFENFSRAARELGSPIAMHVAEQRDDADIIRKNFSKNVLALMRDSGLLRHGAQVIHLNHVTDAEIEILASAGLPAIVCPRSASEKQTGYPSLRTILRKGITVALGTDWWAMDMLDEMKFLRKLPVMFTDYHVLSAVGIVRAGTINGAVALGFDDVVGSIEKGKRADFTLFELDELRTGPVTAGASAEDLAALLVDQLSSRDISDVVIDGQFCLRARQFTGVTEGDVIQGFRRALTRLTRTAQPDPVRKEPPVTAEAKRAKILPFVSTEFSPAPSTFEEGNNRVQTPTVLPVPERKLPPPPAKRALDPKISMPELSKNVKRVFGEDDEI